MNIYAGLFELYSTYWDEFKSARLTSSDLNGPYLCSPGKEYLESMVKIVFVGQETNGWSKRDNVVEQMQTYTDFGLGLRPKIAKKYASSPFWNVIRKIEKAVTGQHYCCASLNLNKFDVNGKSPREPYLATIEKLDHILKAEIQLLQPDVVIFFTGWKYDSRVSKIFSASLTEVDGFKKRELAEISLANEPFKIFRTYHPNYLRMSGLESKVIQELVSKINPQ